MSFRSFLCALVALVSLTPTSRAGFIINTPSALTPGDTFFVVFLDSTPIQATSTDISTYDKAIATAATGITYPGGTIGAWQVIGATEATNAAQQLFTNTTTPVYDLLGNLLASSGVSYLTRGASPDIDQNGVTQFGVAVWTGLNADGSMQFLLTVGFNPAEFGISVLPLRHGGLDQGNAAQNTFSLPLYGYALLTVGPTPQQSPSPVRSHSRSWGSLG
jgi:hypothetical protein